MESADTMIAHEDAPQSSANAKPPRKRWHRCRDLVPAILTQAADPSLALALGGDMIIAVRPGALILEIGASGGGKTSLAASLLVEHAQQVGPAIAMSLELPGEEFTGRVIGIRCDAGWLDVLTGKVPEDRMRDALPERLIVIPRDVAGTSALVEAIEAMRREYPGQSILVAVDYVQLMEESQEREFRRRVADAMKSLDRVARDCRVVIIVASQGSRQASRALSSGERLGAETADAGAEAAELERWSSVTLAIGPHRPSEDIDHAIVQLSVGKARMGGGDRVIPMHYCGRSGRWRVAGASRPPAEVRAEHAAAANEGLMNELVGAATRSPEPLSREKLCKRVKGGATAKRAALDAALASGDLVYVMRRAKRSKSWLVWTPGQAAAAGIPVVPPEPAEEARDA